MAYHQNFMDILDFTLHQHKNRDLFLDGLNHEIK